MREIKFRAWHNTQNVMLQVGDDYGTENPLDCAVYKCQGQDVVLMQYTGLKDRNGREIYEGDVLRIVLGDYVHVFVATSDSFFEDVCYLQNISRFVEYSGYETDGIEVIGNIYESPELLKGEST